MSTIEIKNLTKRYGEAEVLSNINMKLESGKIYGLVGRNGSGKTMLMKHILGFVKATQGTILINGKVVGENVTCRRILVLSSKIRVFCQNILASQI